MMQSLAQIALEPNDQGLAALIARIFKAAIYEQIASMVRAIECCEVER